MPPRAEQASDGSRKEPCGEGTCLIFPSNAEAAAYLVSHYQPQIVGFGEAHADADSKSRSTALRFADTLLPVLAAKSSFLLVELLAPPSGCEAPRREVQKESDAVTEGQAETNQSDYFALGHRARKLAVTPDVLRPSCDDFHQIAAGGDEKLVRMMETIAKLSERVLLARAEKAPKARPLILSYGGALHNDKTPAPNYASWSYGPGLAEATHDRYLEVDLLLPEGLAASPWSRFDWFPRAIAGLDVKRPAEAALVERGPGSVALILAEEPPDASEEPAQGIQD